MDDHISQQLSREQKTGFVLLLIFALLTISLAFLQLRNTIYNPFAIRVSDNTDNAQTLLNIDENVRLQQIDTDQDGLTDYEELNFYETSPYIPDTDSDGIDDATEIENGSDPLCPTGKNCANETSFSAGTTSTAPVFGIGIQTQQAGQILGQFDSNALLGGSAGNGAGSFDVNALLSDPQTLRQLLLSTGQVSEQDLQGISDEELLHMASSSAQTTAKL